MPISNSANSRALEKILYRDLYSGLIRLHVLHHAAEEPIFGLGIMEELGRHGYRMSAGTMYPILHGLEKRGLLQSEQVRHEGRRRRVYTATPLGRAALEAAKGKVRELIGELLENDNELPGARSAPRGERENR